jgi:aminoglycoside phosphotransferase
MATGEQLRRPVFTGKRDYAHKFHDPGFWDAYVQEVVRRHGLPAGIVAVGTRGTFPTFLMGALVFKFFPQRFDGGECFAIEHALHTGPLADPALAVPHYVAHGELFRTGWRWPYLVTTRLDGTPWHAAGLGAPAQHAVAYQIGENMRRIHDLGCPEEQIWRRDVLGELRATAAARRRRQHVLPARLLNQIDTYLAAPSGTHRLVHGDLHADHIFVADAHLVGVIDWGDALCGDPYYELPALFFGTFGARKPLLEAFLDGYGWQVTADFADRAMSMTLAHEFVRITSLLAQPDGVDSLHDLAIRLWQV